MAGSDDAPPVLLVHGWPQNWWAWRHVIPHLAERFRVLAVDLRGHGWTEAPHRGYEKEQLASDLLALLDALELERVTWVGHDWGAWTGFLAALRDPGRFRRMLALAIPHPWADPHPAQLATFLGYQAPLSLPLLGGVIANPMVRRILQVGRGEDRLSSEEVDTFARRIPAHASVAMYRTNLTRELLPILRGRYAGAVLRTPTTVLIGSGDLITRGTSGGAVSGQPQLGVEVLDGVAHWIPEQRPRAIVDWLLGSE
jgi:pimeloyl-ACP methyl ester carboxylesterase